jgi:hypothetical protein
MKQEQAEERPGELAPRSRAIERDYLTALADLVPLETWREICLKTIEDAKYGDPKARDWLARYLIGPKPLTLLDLAADERAVFNAADEIERERKSREKMRLLDGLLSS